MQAEAGGAVTTFRAALIMMGGVTGAVAAVAWDEGDSAAWDVVASAATPAMEPILKAHFNARPSREADGIRRFVENGYRGYSMTVPVAVESENPTEAARVLLRSVGVSPFR